MGIVRIDTAVNWGPREGEVIAERSWISLGIEGILDSNGRLGRKGWMEKGEGLWVTGMVRLDLGAAGEWRVVVVMVYSSSTYLCANSGCFQQDNALHSKHR